MSWSYDRRTGHVTDEEGRIVADSMPEYGYAIAALPELLAACERALAVIHAPHDHGPEAEECGRPDCDALHCAILLASRR